MNLKYVLLLKLIFIILFCPQILIAQESDEKKYIEKKYCNIGRKSTLSIHLGASNRLFTNPENEFYKSTYGFNPSANLTLPIKLKPKFYLRFKASFGGNINMIRFQFAENSSGSTDLYSNYYMGFGLGKAFIWQPHKENESFITITPFFKLIYFPNAERWKNENLSLLGTDYLFDSNNNLSDNSNFSFVPEIKIDYHFKFYGCNSLSVGLYYSRGINNAYIGDIWIQSPDGEVTTQSYKKPFTAYGVAIGYNIFNRKD